MKNTSSPEINHVTFEATHAASNPIDVVYPVTTKTCQTTVQNNPLSVTEYFSNILETRNWPARWVCGNWSEIEGWMYIISDVTIFLAYFSIPIMLFFYIQRKDMGNIRWILLLFISFIALCGITHLIDATLFWIPIYRLSGLVKLMTALVSIGTAIALRYTLPDLLKYKSPRELEKEIDARKKASYILELFMKNSPGAIAMFNNDMNYMAVNNNWLEMFNLSDDLIIGKNHYDSFPMNQKMAELKRFHQRALQGETISKELDMFHFNDTVVYSRWKIHPWYKRYDQIGGIIVFIEGLNDRVALEEKIKQAKQQTDTIIGMSEIARIGTWNLDLTNMAITWSDLVYDIHKMERGSRIILDDAINFYHPEFRPVISQALDRAINHGESWDLELKLLTLEGKEIWVRAIGQAIRDNNNKIVRVQGLFQDIDVKKRAEELLEQSHKQLETKVKKRTHDLEILNQELEAFSYSVSHDLRAPLRAINGFSQALNEDYSESLPHQAKHYLSRIINNSSKMGCLIDDLLEFSRMNKHNELIKELDMNHLVQCLIDDLFQESSHIINLSSLPRCMGDEAMIRQVVQNLISNAIKYSSKEDKPAISIDGKVEGDESIISVADNGVGFDPRHADKLFGIFQRLHREDEFMGNGVGLALCHKIISRHQGRIWAETQLGKESKFYFSLKTVRSNGLS